MVWLIGMVLLLALLALYISRKSAIPSLFLFLLLGMICSALGVEFEDYQLTETFSTIALIVIIFYGGFSTHWPSAKCRIKEAILLSSLGVLLTAGLIGAFAHFVLRIPLMESFLLGAIVSSTDFASVSNILSSKQINLKYQTVALLELESGSNDPMAYTLTMICLALLKQSQISIPLVLLGQVLIGALGGFVMGLLVKRLIYRVNLLQDGVIHIFIFALALLTFAGVSYGKGNGYLAVYIFGMYIGNETFIAKKDIIYFFDGISDLMDIALFFLLGLLAQPIKVIAHLPLALLMMAFITLIARPAAVYLLMRPFRMTQAQLLMVSWSGLRGAAAVAFAIMAINSGINFSIDIYHVVFGICIFSSLIQGSLMAYLSNYLEMVDPSNRLYRSLNYYVGRGNITFMKSEVTPTSKFANRMIQDFNVERDFIIAKVIRQGKGLVPRGNLLIEPGDILVWSGEEYFDPSGHDLIEFSVSDKHRWAHQAIQDLQLPESELIISIMREDEMIPAVGTTILLPGDRLLLYSGDREKSPTSPLGSTN